MQLNKQIQISIFSSLKKFSIKHRLKLSIKFWPWQVKILQESGSWLPKTNCQVSALTSKETNYDITELAAFGNGHDPKLPSRTMLCIWWNHFFSHGGGGGRIFFPDAPGGTCKTFGTSSLLSKVRQQKRIALATRYFCHPFTRTNSSFWF